MQGYCIEVIKLASKWYSPKKFCHAMRVAAYAVDIRPEEDFVDKDEQEDLLFALGVAHDLLEDTECPHSDVANVFRFAPTFAMQDIHLLTKDKDMSYEQYIEKIAHGVDSFLAKSVKIADIKDHLLADDLSDKDKDKYLKALGQLL